MSYPITNPVVGPGESTYLDEAWALKDRIRAEEGVFRQHRSFFEDAYTRSKVYCYRDCATDTLVGFAAARHDGYMLFLAVSPDYRGDGFGARLVGHLAEDYDNVTCHVRATNQNAIGFYGHLGFESLRRIESYYEDGGDAYYLILNGE